MGVILQRVVLCLMGIAVISCNSDNVSDCLQTAGEIVREEVAVPEFTKITVFEKVALILKEGDTQKVELETGKNLKEEVSVTVEGERLIIRNENGCNLFREYGLTTVYVTSPNITEIRSSTGLSIKSDGILSFPSLSLLSESFVVPEAETTDGEFDLHLNTGNLIVVVNGIAYFKLRGNTQNLNVTIAAGDSRIEAQELTAQSISLNHRGSNDILVNPQESISGVLRGYGDVISFNRPEIVEVEELFNGRLIFRD
ncbi:DUF2807 domain-containing protein [Maribacter algicola]|uniref:DUF2807 domain-containing protein n=1 Tax=Maribacter algicola TaxID=2498892 RepID=A0A3R8R643_9FLAO|nr:head GIN domain-containing protein [Maribacter algicola]RRQ47944.1 DUF2807 domain-containing protein [Maribacter algicola]